MKPAVYFQCVVSSVKLCNLGAQIVAQAEKWLHAMLSFNQRSLFVLLFQISATSALPCCNSPAHHPLPPLFLPHHLLVLASPALPSSLLLFPPSSASKIDSLRSKVDLLKLPLALSTKSISERKNQLGGIGEQRGTAGGGGARKARSPPTRDMDNESQYSGYSYKSSHSRSSRKHRWVRPIQVGTLWLITSCICFWSVVWTDSNIGWFKYWIFKYIL